MARTSMDKVHVGIVAAVIGLGLTWLAFGVVSENSDQAHDT